MQERCFEPALAMAQKVANATFTPLLTFPTVANVRMQSVCGLDSIIDDYLTHGTGE